MSLQGSFETIALADVMALLASSRKSGELRVVGDRVEGRLWMQDGCLVGSKVGKARGHVDALFELLRLTEGNFIFKDGVEAPEPEQATPVEPVVRQAEERLTEWRDIEVVVPSLEHRVRLTPDLPAPEVTLSGDAWRLVMAVALAGTVRGVIEEIGLGQFEGCRGIRHMVESGLVIVDPPRVRPSATDPARARRVASSDGEEVSADGSVQALPVDLFAALAGPQSMSSAPMTAAGASASTNGAGNGGTNGAFGGAFGGASDGATTGASDGENGSVGSDGSAAAPVVSVVSTGSIPADGVSNGSVSSGRDLLSLVQAPNADVISLSAVDDRFSPAGHEQSEVVVLRAVPDSDGLDEVDEVDLPRPTVGNAERPATAPVDEPASVEHPDESSHATSEPQERDSGGETINRGLLLKFLSSVRS